MEHAARSSAVARESTPPAPPGEGVHGIALHVAIALASFALLATAQLYAFTLLAQLSASRHGAVKAVLGVSAGAFLLFTAISLLRQSALMVLAYGGAAGGARHRLRETAVWPSVCVIVPAHNEAGRVEPAIEALLAADYPGLEILVVDDGSSDDTFARASRLAGRHGSKHVRVERKENGGKWSALNLGFHLTRAELVVCVDADSQLAPDSLKLLARGFDDPTLGGCAGQVVIRERPNLIRQLQALEYHLLNGLQRQAQSAMSSVLVAPGPLAMFRRCALEEVWQAWGKPEPLPITRAGARVNGPWEDDTFAEDADLTLNVLLTGRGVTYEPRAVSRTSAPDSIPKLLNQRYRWTRGSFQAALKAWRRWHRSPKAPRRVLAWLGLFLVDSVVWPAVNLGGLAAFLLIVALFGVQDSLLVWILALTAMDLNEAAFAARLDRADGSLLKLTPLNRVYYNILLDVGRFYALYDELRGRSMRWS
ncbi:MAG: glycosyltransferase family 2 protein [Myxococcales bacterium]